MVRESYRREQGFPAAAPAMRWCSWQRRVGDAEARQKVEGKQTVFWRRGAGATQEKESASGHSPKNTIKVETDSSWTRYAGAGSHRTADGVTYHAGRGTVQEIRPKQHGHAVGRGISAAGAGKGVDASGLDHYRLLGLPPDATTEEIERVYRRSVARIHPDKFSTDPEMHALAEQKMKQLNLAIQILRDPARRAEHDHALTGRALAAPPLSRRLQGAHDRSLESVADGR